MKTRIYIGFLSFIVVLSTVVGIRKKDTILRILPTVYAGEDNARNIEVEPEGDVGILENTEETEKTSEIGGVTGGSTEISETGIETDIETETETETETEISNQGTTDDDQNEYVVINDYFKVKVDTSEIIGITGSMDDASITSVTIPKDIKIIGEKAFEGYKYIEEITFEEGSKLKTIGDYAFNYCVALKSIVLPTGVTKIGQYSFMNCESLESITLPEGLKTISYRVFEGCLSLKDIKVPTTVTKGTEILGRNCGVETVTFTKGRTYIPANILRNCSGVKKVVMSKGVTVIRKNAMYGCIALKKVTAPTTLKKININAFRDCQSLKKYKIRSTVYYIGPSSFRDCSNLENLTLHKGITAIGKNAFAGDSKLVLLVWANSKQKTYAINNKLKWDYSDAEKERRKLSFSARNKLLSISVGKKTDFKLKKLKNYVPQGVCRVGNYLVVSAYRNGLKGRSILLIYNKNGKYIKYAYLPSVDHNGSLANIKGRLAVSINNASALDYLGIISVPKLKKVKNGKALTYDYRVKLKSHADFTDFDGTYFWAGRCVDSEWCVMCGYRVSLKKVKISKHKKERRLVFTKLYTYKVPENIQGVAVIKKSRYKRQIICTQSYGVLPDSKIIVYNINLKRDKSLGKPDATYRVPSMLEGITKKGNYLFLVFESAAGKYTTEPEHQTDIRVKRVLRIRYKKLNKLLKYE